MKTCASGRPIVKTPAFPTPTKKRKNIRKSQPGTKPSGPGVKTMRPVASEMVTADIMNTVRRPILSPSHPPEEGARNRAEAGGKQDSPSLPIGQRPLLGQRRSDVSEHEKIKELRHICQVRHADQLP